MIEELVEFGLSHEEASVYLSLLQLGAARGSELAKKSGLQRTNIYHLVKKLELKGLVSQVQKGTHLYFSAADPSRLAQLASSKVTLINNIMPELLGIKNTIARKPKVKFFERKSGLENIFQDTLTAKGEILGFTNLALLVEFFPGFLRTYSKERIKRGIKVRYLCPEIESHNKQLYFELLSELIPKDSEKSFLEVLFVNPSQFPFKSEMSIYGNKVSFMSLTAEEQLGILVENSAIAESMRAIFDLAWIGASNFVAI